MAAPVNTVLPAITGTVTVGSALALSNGTWTDDGSPAFVYAWLRDGVVIASQVANAYTIALADIAALLTGRVTNTDTGGTTAATSAATIAVPSTLVVETGAVVASADSYLSITDADTYHAARANTAWAALAASAKEAALRKATDYMLQMYRARWKGVRYSATQTLDWPRAYVYTDPALTGAIGEFPYLVTSNIVPTEVKNACAELALKAATADLAPDLERAKLSTTVGPIAVTYDRATPQYTRYRAIDATLAPYLGGSSVNIQLLRT